MLGPMPRASSCLGLSLVLALSLLAPAARAVSDAVASAAELVRQAKQHEAAHEDLVAIRRYTEALSIDPTNGDGYIGLGHLRLRRGDLREAERVFDVGLAHVPALTAALRGRAEARWALGFHEQAERDLEEYARVADDPHALKELARWYEEESRPPAQLATWRRIRVLAVAKKDAGLEKEARTMVRALQITIGSADPVAMPPSDDPVRRGLARLAKR
jgi:tetratricopeptide (TPR) repeat protein